jgi:hypothetical protein
VEKLAAKVAVMHVVVVMAMAMAKFHSKTECRFCEFCRDFSRVVVEEFSLQNSRKIAQYLIVNNFIKERHSYFIVKKRIRTDELNNNDGMWGSVMEK